MPIQKFAPMSKDFPTFDCDAHVTEPPWLWERAKDYLTKAEFEALRNSIWFDEESKQLIVNGFAKLLELAEFESRLTALEQANAGAPMERRFNA